MKNLKDTVLVGAVAGIALLSAFGVAQKAGSGPATGGGNDKETQDPAFTGTIQLPQDAPGQDGAGDEAAETARYQKLARITQDRAVQAAQMYLKSTVAPTKVSLEGENGYLVWEVVIGGQELKVDAGDGRVLHAAKADTENEAGETGEAAEQENDGK